LKRKNLRDAQKREELNKERARQKGKVSMLLIEEIKFNGKSEK